MMADWKRNCTCVSLLSWLFIIDRNPLHDPVNDGMIVRSGQRWRWVDFFYSYWFKWTYKYAGWYSVIVNCRYLCSDPLVWWIIRDGVSHLFWGSLSCDSVAMGVWWLWWVFPTVSGTMVELFENNSIHVKVCVRMIHDGNVLKCSSIVNYSSEWCRWPCTIILWWAIDAIFDVVQLLWWEFRHEFESVTSLYTWFLMLRTQMIGLVHMVIRQSLQM